MPNLCYIDIYPYICKKSVIRGSYFNTKKWIKEGRRSGPLYYLICGC